jgi:predicted ribosomally synthesized peptide with SipW-like signal peptide
MTDDKKLALSRRKLLGGLGGVGLAGAGAGLGTSALFNDEETFENNSITAGTLDMTVDAEIVAANGYYTNSGDGPDIIGDMGTADGAAVVGLQAGDVKPGDWVIICFDITIEDNPGYVLVQANNLESDENGFEEPEPSDSNSEGELDDKLLTTVWDDYDDSGNRSGLSTLDIVTNNAASSFPDSASTSHSWASGRSEGGKVNSDIHYTTLKETYDNWFDDGFLLGPGPGSDASKIGGPANDQESKVVYLLLEVPDTVGNEIQGDSVSFDLVFETEQVRNNDDPFGTAYPNDPWLADAQTDKGGVFWNHPGDDNEFALSPGDTFNNLPSPGQPIYVNLTDSPIDITIDDGNSGTSVTLGAGPYDSSEDFHNLGSGADWVRIPGGAGTPNPVTGAPNYEFVGITETSNGYEVEWQLV